MKSFLAFVFSLALIVSAGAQTLPFPTWNPQQKILTFVTNEAKAAGGASPMTFDNAGAHFNIGPANTTRIVHVAFSTNSGLPTLASITICGVSGTINVSRNNATTTVSTSIASAAVPTGTTCDVTATIGGGSNHASLSVYYSTGGASATATATANALTCTTCNLNLTTLAGGYTIASFMQNNNGTIAAWSGIVTADFAGNNYSSAASDTTASTQKNSAGTSTVTATIASSTGTAAVSASF